MKPAFEVVFEDDALVVLNKLVKILIQPSPKKEKHTLTTLLEKAENKKCICLWISFGLLLFLYSYGCEI